MKITDLYNKLLKFEKNNKIKILESWDNRHNEELQKTINNLILYRVMKPNEIILNNLIIKNVYHISINYFNKTLKINENITILIDKIRKLEIQTPNN